MSKNTKGTMSKNTRPKTGKNQLLYLPFQTIERLHKLAAREGVTMSRFVADLIDKAATKKRLW